MPQIGMSNGRDEISVPVTVPRVTAAHLERYIEIRAINPDGTEGVGYHRGVRGFS